MSRNRLNRRLRYRVRRWCAVVVRCGWNALPVPVQDAVIVGGAVTPFVVLFLRVSKVRP